MSLSSFFIIHLFFLSLSKMLPFKVAEGTEKKKKKTNKTTKQGGGGEGGKLNMISREHESE